VDLSRIDRVLEQQERRGRTNAFIVVSVGRLIAIKNPCVVLEGVLRGVRPTARLSFVGEGPLEEQLRARAESGPSDLSIELTGLVPRELVYKRLARSDLFVSASLSEGLPVAVLEAMACRCPVVLSDIAAHRDSVGDADFIPLIHPNDVSGFATEVSRFQAMSPLERAQIGDCCRALVEKRFSLAATHEQYEAVYRQVSRA
jgi:glycosyltransferase involved in cell wall biosynthesis